MPDRVLAFQDASRGRRLLAVIGLFVLLSSLVFGFGPRMLDLGGLEAATTRNPLELKSIRQHLYVWLVEPSRAWDDSWGVMLEAYDWLQEPHEHTLYQDVFFGRQHKFQYPLTALLPLTAMAKLGVAPTAHRLNIIGWGWIAMTALAMAAFSAVLAKRSGVVEPVGWRARAMVGAAAAFATLTFYPIMLGYTIGQIQTWITGAFVLVCLCWIYDRRLLAGMLIGAICVVKPQFALFPVWAILRRQWSFLIGWTVIVAAMLGLAFGLYGLANNLDYLSVLRFLSLHGENYFHNQSVNGLLNRLLNPGDSLRMPPEFPPYNSLVYAATLLSSAVVILGALLLRGRGSDRGSLLDLMTAALSFTIASPIAWEYHYGIELPIFAVLLFALLAETRSRRRWGLIAMLAAAYVLSANYFPIANRAAQSPFNFVQSYLLLAGLAALWLLYRIRAPFGWHSAGRSTAPTPSPGRGAAGSPPSAWRDPASAPGGSR